MDRRTRAPVCGSNSIIYESHRLRNTQPPVSRRALCPRPNPAGLSERGGLLPPAAGCVTIGAAGGISTDDMKRSVASMLNCIAVGLGGFLGSVYRYLAGQIPLGRDWGFPVRTLAINLIGSFLIGAVTALALKRAAPRPQAGALPEGRGVRGLHHLLLFCPGNRRSSAKRAHGGGPALCGGKPDPRRCGGICRGSGGALTPPWRTVEKSLCFFENFTCIFKTFLL